MSGNTLKSNLYNITLFLFFIAFYSFLSLIFLLLLYLEFPFLSAEIKIDNFQKRQETLEEMCETRYKIVDKTVANKKKSKR